MVFSFIEFRVVISCSISLQSKPQPCLRCRDEILGESRIERPGFKTMGSARYGAESDTDTRVPQAVGEVAALIVEQIDVSDPDPGGREAAQIRAPRRNGVGRDVRRTRLLRQK